jgi:hypothetical protein
LIKFLCNLNKAACPPTVKKMLAACAKVICFSLRYFSFIFSPKIGIFEKLTFFVSLIASHFVYFPDFYIQKGIQLLTKCSLAIPSRVV